MARGDMPRYLVRSCSTVWILVATGLIGYQMALHMMQALSSSRATVLARCPANEPGMIGKLLDAGAAGIICPMINTAQEAASIPLRRTIGAYAAPSTPHVGYSLPIDCKWCTVAPSNTGR